MFLFCSFCSKLNVVSSFVAQLSGAISEILVMVTESKIKVDGSRIVAKKDVVAVFFATQDASSKILFGPQH